MTYDIISPLNRWGPDFLQAFSTLGSREAVLLWLTHHSLPATDNLILPLEEELHPGQSHSSYFPCGSVPTVHTSLPSVLGWGRMGSHKTAQKGRGL